ncbi:TetR/AcrR family transcriptional regulator [Agromyces cerinus]|uniref:Transcriptional regulator, TetR family n=1 Tax=Agromyces cerinus subsp. cerinus TaxID=232089 RepID=A0A1N6F587_9MICO|nr:TetR/AcrR family transcriptional regulator [Agromyces cerinus]SIN90409.1 transcriptional regulator, TetR family [Agromyces cerinus subsp. cerinus]
MPPNSSGPEAAPPTASAGSARPAASAQPAGSARPAASARGRATRERIVAAAARCFAASGYRGVSLRDVAAEAGLSHPGVLRHFSSREQILDAVVTRFELENEHWLAARTDVPPHLLIALAEHNQSKPGYLELFSALAGEAVSPEHPAHGRFATRYRELREESLRQPPATPWSRDDATRMLAGWDGLQLASLYNPGEVDVAAELAQQLTGRREQAGAEPEAGAGAEAGAGDGPTAAASAADTRPASHATPADEPQPSTPATAPSAGYAVGRARQARIIADATELFARRGFHDTSLREVAEAVGISKSALLHHFPTKDALLVSVIAERDRRTVPSSEELLAASPAETIELMVRTARRSELDTPGLVEVYTVLTSEAASPGHPAHRFFAERSRRTIADVTVLFELLAADGLLAPGRDPRHEGRWVPAMWDGLQVQWGYDPSIDVAALLADYFDAAVTFSVQAPPRVSPPA